jgi:hypothetical protein
MRSETGPPSLSAPLLTQPRFPLGCPQIRPSGKRQRVLREGPRQLVQCPETLRTMTLNSAQLLGICYVPYWNVLDNRDL